MDSVIYTLANDRTVEWLVALLASLEKNRCAVRIIVIPFDDNLKQTASACSRSGLDVAIFGDHGRLAKMDELGRTVFFPGERPNMMRKYAPLEKGQPFFYLDSDIAITSPLFNQYLEDLKKIPEEFVYTDNDLTMVYRDVALRKRMVDEYHSVGFNAGAFFFPHGGLTHQDFQANVPGYLACREGYIRGVGDQCFINYAVDMSKLSKAYAHERFPYISYSTYSGKYRGIIFSKRKPLPVPFVHWAGVGITYQMPLKRFFFSMRLRGAGLGERLRFYWLFFRQSCVTYYRRIPAHKFGLRTLYLHIKAKRAGVVNSDLLWE